MEQILSNSKVIYLSSEINGIAIVALVLVICALLMSLVACYIVANNVFEEIRYVKATKKKCFSVLIFMRLLSVVLMLGGNIILACCTYPAVCENENKKFNYVLEVNDNVSPQQVSDYFVINSMNGKKYDVTLREYNEDSVNALNEKHQAFISTNT